MYKWFLNIVFFAITALGAAAGLQAQSNLDEQIAKLKADPSNPAVREQIIKTASEMKPPPEIPEAARRAFVQGNTLAKEAKDVAGQQLAIAAYKDAVLAAPWWGDPYFNLARTEELIGSFAAARESLGWFIKTKPGEKEEREAQDRIYSLEAKEKLAQATATNEAETARRKAEEQQRLRDEEAALWQNSAWNVLFGKRNLNGTAQKDGQTVRFHHDSNLDGPFLRGTLQDGNVQYWTYNAVGCGDRPVTVTASADRRRFEFMAPGCAIAPTPQMTSSGPRLVFFWEGSMILTVVTKK